MATQLLIAGAGASKLAYSKSLRQLRERATIGSTLPRWAEIAVTAALRLIAARVKTSKPVVESVLRLSEPVTYTCTSHVEPGSLLCGLHISLIRLTGTLGPNKATTPAPSHGSNMSCSTNCILEGLSPRYIYEGMLPQQAGCQGATPGGPMFFLGEVTLRRLFNATGGSKPSTKEFREAC